MMGLPMLVAGLVFAIDGKSAAATMLALTTGGLMIAVTIRLGRSGAIVDPQQRMVVIRQIVATRRIDVDAVEELRFGRGLQLNPTLYVIRSGGKRPIAVPGIGYSLAGVGRVDAYEVARRLAESIGNLSGRTPAVT